MSGFINRRDAGKQLARLLFKYAPDGRERNTIVLGLPRGGVPVAYEVAKALRAPLDVFIVRKIGVPVQPELAMGALASGGMVVRNEDVVRHLNITDRMFDAVVEREREELERRELAYRGSVGSYDVHGGTCIVVDDGIATGASMMSAVLALRTKNPARIVVAVPVAPPSVLREFRLHADDVVSVLTPNEFAAVGSWYEDFDQTSDEEVHDLLQKGRLFGCAEDPNISREERPPLV